VNSVLQSGESLTQSINLKFQSGNEPMAAAENENAVSSDGEISDAELERLEKEAKAVTSKLEKIENHVLKTHARREELLSNVNYVREIKESFENRWRLAVEENRKLLNNITGLQREIESIQFERQADEQRFEGFRKEQENLLRIIETKDQEITLYQQTMEEKNQYLNERIKQINSISSINETLVKENERLVNFYNISMKETELRQIAERNSVEREYSIVKEQNLHLEREVRHLNEENSRQVAENTDARRELDRLRMEIKQKHQELGTKSIEQESWRVCELDFEERKAKYENEISYLNQQVPNYNIIICYY
jgi:chromosome segregation ATPase